MQSYHLSVTRLRTEPNYPHQHALLPRFFHWREEKRRAEEVVRSRHSLFSMLLSQKLVKRHPTLKRRLYILHLHANRTKQRHAISLDLPWLVGKATWDGGATGGVEGIPVLVFLIGAAALLGAARPTLLSNLTLDPRPRPKDVDIISVFEPFLSKLSQNGKTPRTEKETKK